MDHSLSPPLGPRNHRTGLVGHRLIMTTCIGIATTDDIPRTDHPSRASDALARHAAASLRAAKHDRGTTPGWRTEIWDDRVWIAPPLAPGRPIDLSSRRSPPLGHRAAETVTIPPTPA